MEQPGGDELPSRPPLQDRSPATTRASRPADRGLGDRCFLDQHGAVPATRSDAGVFIVFALLGFAAGEIVALVFTAVAADLAGQGNRLQAIARMSAPPAWYVGASLVGLWVGFAAGPWLASMARGTRHLAADLGIRFRAIDVAGIPIGFGGQLVVTALYTPFIRHLHNFNAPTTKLTGGAHGFAFAVIAILTVIGAPFFEELFFRGLVLRGLLRLFAPSDSARGAARSLAVVAAVAVDGTIFGLAHAELVQLAGLALFGVMLATVSYRTGRLGMNMVAHASFNLVAVVAIVASRGGVIF